jgi:hypothetical protein
MGIFSWISSIFSPAAELIDNLHTSDEEKLTLRNQLASMQTKVNTKLIALEQAKVEAQSKVQIAEADSSYFLTANWRPICSLLIVGIIVGDSFGWLKAGPQIYDLAKVFLGAYTTSRGVEKVAKTFKL